jgi:hypothetical protein
MREFLSANFALKRFFACMDSWVLCQIAGLGKLLIANSTLMGLKIEKKSNIFLLSLKLISSYLACLMDAKVFLQILLLSERNLTNFTMLNIFALMFFDMRNQRMLLEKGDIAIFAFESIERCMDLLDMFV